MNPTTPYHDVLPPLSTEERTALEISIAAEGVRNPCLATEDGRLLDGHNRLAIDPKAPVQTVPGSAGWTDEECHAFIFRINHERRNLSPEQKRELREKMIATARNLKSQGLTYEVLAVMFGVPLSTMHEWIIPISGTGNGNKFDARVVVPPAAWNSVLDRVEAGETQEQVAADIGVPRRTAQDYIIIYQRRDEWATVAHLGVRGVLEYLRTGKTGEEDEAVGSPPHVARNTGEHEWYTPPEYLDAARDRGEATPPPTEGRAE